MEKQVGGMNQWPGWGRIARELIKNDGTKSYSSKPIEKDESEELEGNHYRLERRPGREDTEVDQKLERLKEQLLMEPGAKDNSDPLFGPHHCL